MELRRKWQQCHPHPHIRCIKIRFGVFSAPKYGWTTSTFVKRTETQAAVTHLTPNESIWTQTLFSGGLLWGKAAAGKIKSLNLRHCSWLLTAVHLQHGDAIYKSPLCGSLGDGAGVQLSAADRDVSATKLCIQKHPNRPAWDPGSSSCGMKNSSWRGRRLGSLLSLK